MCLKKIFERMPRNFTLTVTLPHNFNFLCLFLHSKIIHSSKIICFFFGFFTRLKCRSLNWRCGFCCYFICLCAIDSQVARPTTVSCIIFNVWGAGKCISQWNVWLCKLRIKDYTQRIIKWYFLEFFSWSGKCLLQRNFLLLLLSFEE